MGKEDLLRHKQAPEIFEALQKAGEQIVAGFAIQGARPISLKSFNLTSSLPPSAVVNSRMTMKMAARRLRLCSSTRLSVPRFG